MTRPYHHPCLQTPWSFHSWCLHPFPLIRHAHCPRKLLLSRVLRNRDGKNSHKLGVYNTWLQTTGDTSELSPPKKTEREQWVVAITKSQSPCSVTYDPKTTLLPPLSHNLLTPGDVLSNCTRAKLVGSAKKHTRSAEERGFWPGEAEVTALPQLLSTTGTHASRVPRV